MKNIKLFTNHSTYEQYINSDWKILPNVSYCLDARDVHYNDNAGAVIRATFFANADRSQDNKRSFQLYGFMSEEGVFGADMFSKIIVDGEELSIQELDANYGTYRMLPGVEHVVEYTVLDSTLIGGVVLQEGTATRFGAIFNECVYLTSISIPNTVTTIGTSSLSGCFALTAVTLPSGVTEIYGYAFTRCGGDVTCLSTTPPTLYGDPGIEGYIYVPSESLNAYKSADGWSNYASVIYPIGGGNSGPVA